GSPEAVVFAVAFVVDVSETAPVCVSSGPELICAADRTLSIESATAGATLTLPPVAPVFALVVVVFVADAARVRSCDETDALPGSAPTNAVVFTLRRSSATDAPTPTPEPVVVFVAASAFAFAVDVDDAASVASPVPASAWP